MRIPDDDWREFEKRHNVCAICCQAVHPPDQPGRHDFVPCRQCGTSLLFDTFGRLHYSVPDSIPEFLKQNQILKSIPATTLQSLPETVARENSAVPIAIRGDFLIVGMVHPTIDAIDRLRFILNRDVLAVKISEETFAKLVCSYNDLKGGDV